ncbi:ferrochelatase [bacterium]|nr:ferrochelatase [bacterium]
MNKTAVILLQLGGPVSLETVEPFLFNLFCDPDIIDLPLAFLFRKRLARLISTRRTPAVQELYKRIGKRSPILKQTRLQAEALQHSLLKKNIQADVFIAMRYWHPMTEEVVQQIRNRGYEKIVLLPLYPHYCKATTGSSINEWKRITQRLHVNGFETRVIESYYDHPAYIDALVERIQRTIRRVPEKDRNKIHLVFSAHGTPLKLVKNGDPYSRHIQRTYELVLEKGQFGLAHHLCFQSKVGPQKWLEPSLVQTVEKLAHNKVSHIIAIPIAFVTDHIETLSEINIEAKAEAKKLGIIHFDMTPALIRSPKFIECLTDVVAKELN